MSIALMRIAAIALALGAAPLPGRTVPAQDIPVPDTVSPQLRVRIAQPDIAWPREAPATNDGWRRLGDPDPQATEANVAAWLKALDLRLEEKRYGGVPCFEIVPARPVAANRGRLLVHLHGGGYVLWGGKSGLKEAIFVAGRSGIRTISIDYRMPPEHPFPAPMDDATAAWKAIAAAHPVQRLGLFGTSAGGAMVLALVQRAQREGLPLPAAIMAGTPWSDLGETGDSYATNKYLDPLSYEGLLRPAARQYAGDIDPRDPRLSPVYGSFDGFPPTLLLSGTRDLFLSNTVRVDRGIRDAGGRSELIVYEGQSHGRYLAGLDFPETQTFLNDVSGFWRRWLR